MTSFLLSISGIQLAVIAFLIWRLNAERRMRVEAETNLATAAQYAEATSNVLGGVVSGMGDDIVERLRKGGF